MILCHFERWAGEERRGKNNEKRIHVHADSNVTSFITFNVFPKKLTNRTKAIAKIFEMKHQRKQQAAAASTLPLNRITNSQMKQHNFK